MGWKMIWEGLYRKEIGKGAFATVGEHPGHWIARVWGAAGEEPILTKALATKKHAQAWAEKMALETWVTE